MKIKKKIMLFVALISMFYCVSLIQSTYAKYVTSTTGTANMTIARWKILVNSQDVTNNSNFSTTIEPTFSGNRNIRDGVIAPTATGYFDIVLDATDVDVSMSYNISIGDSIYNTVPDLKVLSYTINDVTTTYNNSITGQILLDDTEKEVTVRFNVQWYEGTNEEMNNTLDTEAANDGVAAIDVNINFIQVQ